MREDYFKDIYNDFFGVESDINSNKEESQDKMAFLFEKINNLYITEEYKNLLKKIIEYMRKYDEKIESIYVPFRLILEINNDETSNLITEILKEAATYFSYIDSDTKDISLYKLDKNLKDIFTGFCKEEGHSDKLEYFCKNHNQLCCSSCIVKIKKKGKGQHTDCDVYIIEDIKADKINDLKDATMSIDYLQKTDLVVLAQRILGDPVVSSFELLMDNGR